jgi:hypothetical protein
VRILAISLWYYPEPVVKPHQLAVALARRGHQVTVITGFHNHPDGSRLDAIMLMPRCR